MPTMVFKLYVCDCFEIKHLGRNILHTKITFNSNQAVPSDMAERRREERIQIPFRASVCGEDTKCEAFEVNTVIDNLSAGGLYLRLAQCLEEGAKLIVTARLSMSAVDKNLGPVVLLRSKVLRVEPKPGGVYGVALAIIHRRFL